MDNKNTRVEDTTDDEAHRNTDSVARAQEDELDLDQLDLRVEEIEERISPSETNVFDK